MLRALGSTEVEVEVEVSIYRDNDAFFVEIMSTLSVIKSSFERSYDEQNIIRVVISYEIYQTRRRLV